MSTSTKTGWSLGCGVVVLLLSGCAGAGGNTVAIEPSQARDANAFAPVMKNSAAPGALGEEARLSPAPPAPPSSSSVERRVENEKSERPGLGTSWGETRESVVHEVAFARMDEDHPFAMATLHYDDRRGVEALAAYHASRDREAREVSVANVLGVSIRDANGSSLPTLGVGDRTYVVGHAGERYAIVLTNRSRHRIEAVATVDGLDVLNGKSGSFDNRGYLLAPYATITIDGFRQSQSAVAAFRFASVGESYAAQTGSARNVGVIGVAFFNEEGDAINDDRDVETRDTAIPFPASGRPYAQPPPTWRAF
jgi:hypothetical protein